MYVKAMTIVTCLAVACLAPAFRVARGDPPEPTPRQTLVAPRLSSPLTIDADPADWPKQAPQAKMALDPDSDEYRGAARVAWDAGFLYVVFEVASGKPMRNAGDDPATAFKTGDTVELLLSVNDRPLADRVPRGPNVDTAKPGDYKILMTLLRNTKPTVFGLDFVHPELGQNPQVFQMAGPKTVVDQAAIVTGARMAVRKAAVGDVAGFVVEAKIPWAYFRDHQPKVGEKLLFNLAINFSNQSGTANMGKAYWNGPSHMVQDVGIEAQIHPEHWGWLVLGGP
jgi:hypothetical protein